MAVLWLARRFPLEGRRLEAPPRLPLPLRHALGGLGHRRLPRSSTTSSSSTAPDKPYSPWVTLRWIIFNSSENYGIYGLRARLRPRRQLLPPLPRGRAARRATASAALAGAASGFEDAAPPALPLQHAPLHLRARPQRPGGRRPHDRALRRLPPPHARKLRHAGSHAPEGAGVLAVLPGDRAHPLPGSAHHPHGDRLALARLARAEPHPPAHRRERPPPRHRPAFDTGTHRDFRETE